MCIYTHKRLREEKIIEEQLLYEDVICTYTSNEKRWPPLSPPHNHLQQSQKDYGSHHITLAMEINKHFSWHTRNIREHLPWTHLIQASPVA